MSKIFFVVLALAWEDVQFDEYFSDGLKPPTSFDVHPLFGEGVHFDEHIFRKH